MDEFSRIGDADGVAVDLKSENGGNDEQYEDFVEESKFDSVEERADYFYSLYFKLKSQLEETKHELEDNLEVYKTLEDEVEETSRAHQEAAADAERLEAEKTSLAARVEDLDESVKSWQAKHVELQKQFASTSDSMTREIDHLKKERDSAKHAVVTLEQGNDELEQGQRHAMSSLLDLTTEYNKIVEEKTMLEEEVIAKTQVQNSLREELQRTKDDLRDQTEDLDLLRSQLLESQSQTLHFQLQLQSIRTTPPSDLTPLPRADFMSPVIEASFESSSPATAMSTPTPVFASSRSADLLSAGAQEDAREERDEESLTANTSHSGLGGSSPTGSGAISPSTPSKVIPVPRQRIPAAKPSTPPSAVKRTAAIQTRFDNGSLLPTPTPPKFPASPRPLRNSMLGPGTLNRSQVSRNIAGIAGSTTPGSPSTRGRPAPSNLGTSMSSMPARGPLSVVPPSAKKVPVTKMVADYRLRMTDLKTRLSHIDMRKNKKVAGATVDDVADREREREEKLRNLGKRTGGTVTPARVTALLGQSRAGSSSRQPRQDSEGKSSVDSDQTSWVVVKDEDGVPTPETIAAQGLGLQEKGMRSLSSSVSTQSSKPLPERPGIPSPLAVTHRSFESSNSDRTLKPAPRPSSRLSSSHSGITAASSSSSSDDVRPETPQADKEGNDDRQREPVSASGSRPSSALGYRPGSSMSVRAGSMLSSRPGSAFGHRPESAASQRSHISAVESNSVRRGAKTQSTSGLPNGRPNDVKVLFPGSDATSSAASSRPESRQGTRPNGRDSSYVSPYAQRPRAPSGVAKSPSMQLSVSTRLPQPASEPESSSGIPRSRKRQSLGGSANAGSSLPVPVASGRRSVSGRPMSVDLQTSLQTAPPVPPMSPQHKSMAEAKRTQGFGVGMGYPSPVKER